MELREEGEFGKCAKALPFARQGRLMSVLHHFHNVARMRAQADDGLRAPSDGGTHIVRLENVPDVGLGKLERGEDPGLR